MAAETQYTPNTGMVQISTANTNLDGSGTLGTVLTAASNGTLVKTVIIKAITNTTQGMVRLFIYDGSNTKLLREVEIPAITKSASEPAFGVTIPLNFTLKSGWILKASTENAETFNVIAEGQNWTYYATSVRSETTKYVGYNGIATLSTANSNLNGTGTLAAPLLSSNCNLVSVLIKARQSTTQGMIRLYFYYSGGPTLLFKEIPVPAVTCSATAQTFSHREVFPNFFALKTGWYIKASTEKGESFTILTESLDWSYPA